MFIIVTKYLIPKGFRGITIFPFVLLRNQTDVSNLIILNHERIHIRQQLELLILPFFIWYGVEFLIRLLISKDKIQAYRNISFEKEAYHNENNLTYLSNRKLFSFMKYFRL